MIFFEQSKDVAIGGWILFQDITFILIIVKIFLREENSTLLIGDFHPACWMSDLSGENCLNCDICVDRELTTLTDNYNLEKF